MEGKLVKRDEAWWCLEPGGEGLEGSPAAMACHISFSFERRAEAVEGRCGRSRKEHSSTRHRSHRADKTQGGKRQPRSRGKGWKWGRRGRRGLHSQSRCFFLGPMISWVVALHTVLETAEPVTLCWAAVIRSVRLWPDISAARPPPLPLGSRRGLGPPSV